MVSVSADGIGVFVIGVGEGDWVEVGARCRLFGLELGLWVRSVVGGCMGLALRLLLLGVVVMLSLF